MPIGTVGAIIGSSLIGGLASSSAAGTQSRAAKSAADAQLLAARETNDMLRDFRTEDIERFQPYYEGGTDAFNALRFETGLGDRPEGYGGFTATPGYDFRFNEGMRGVEQSVAARQGLLSGAALEATNRFGQDYGSNEYNNYLARLGGIAQGGQSAAGMQANTSANFGTQIGNNMMAGGQAAAQGIANAGNASAAGTVGMANAFMGGAQNLVGNWQYQNMLKSFAPAQSGSNNFQGLY